ncbi:MAG: cell division protein FtsX [Boseongicola sp.]|nr:cell division protein FtsX [Boseongicola sp.]
MMVRRWLFPDGIAERVVPSTGFTAALTILSAAAMAFLAVLALALALAADDMAARWEAELSGTATIRISAPADQRAAQTDAVLSALGQTPGIATTRVVDEAEQKALLEPWFGSDLPLDTLRLPVLIEVTEAGDGPDLEGLSQRLAAEAPGAVYDNHARWRAPLIGAAGRLRTIGFTALVLIAGVTATTIALAASAALAANGQIIDVLKLVGARDAWITRAFVRRFTARAFLGGVAGTLLALIVVLLFPSGAETGILSAIGFNGFEWLWPLFVPLAGAGLAFVATHVAARRRLNEVA